MGQNITLASELSGLQIHLQESNSREEGGLFADDADAPECEGDQEDKEA